MSAVKEMDPALKRLLDDLPKGSPDLPQLEVWLAFCEPRHIVPARVPVTISFGQWHGPPMAADEVVIHVRNTKNGAEQAFTMPAETWTHPSINPGDLVSLTDFTFTVIPGERP